jgi:hypothetical protein
MVCHLSQFDAAKMPHADVEEMLPLAFGSQ